MREETEMANGEITGSASENGIEATGDAIIIADAIERGLGAIAEAVRMVTRGLMGEDAEPVEESDFYLDGTRK